MKIGRLRFIATLVIRGELPLIIPFTVERVLNILMGLEKGADQIQLMLLGMLSLTVDIILVRIVRGVVGVDTTVRKTGRPLEAIIKYQKQILTNLQV